MVTAFCGDSMGALAEIFMGGNPYNNVEAIEKPWGPMMSFPTPTIEDGRHPLVRQLHWSKDILIVCFFFGDLGAM